jgi:AcrR family transcriptional regulator
MSDRYHHGALREALVDTALDLIAERGPAGFSVAEVARRAEVSAAAPYRHFPDRAALLAAVAGAAARRLSAKIAAVLDASKSSVDQLAAAAAAYTEFVIERRAGLQVIFAAELRDRRDAELQADTRALTDPLLALCLELSGSAPDALDLLERFFALSHGYASIHLDGVFAQRAHDTATVAAKSANAVRALVS